MADPQSIADAVGSGMYERDRAAQALGITVEAIGPGLARCRMIVRDDMVQGHTTCHGGLTFTLADTAFAYACNACNRATVALGAEIAFLAPARAGDVLCATARERSRSGGVAAGAPRASTTSSSAMAPAHSSRCSAVPPTRRAAR
jgi:acyl-CoA thioesterase